MLLLPAVVQAQFTFTTNNGAITITGYTGSGGNVVIPGWTNGFPITRIAKNAFYVCSSVSSVAIGTNVSTVESGVFFLCSSMTNVTIPKSVTYIATSAIQDCTNLAAITVATNNTFYSSTNGVLLDKAQKKLIAFPGGLTGKYVAPNTVASIEPYAFYGCTGPTNIAIGNSITNIGALAFCNCFALKSVTISNSVVGIGDRTFANCPSLTTITVDANNPAYSSAGGVLFDKGQTRLIQCPVGKAGSYTMPNSITNVGDYSFWGCNNLSDVTIGSGVKRIEGNVFEDCTKLSNVTVPDSVTNLGTGVFFGCSKLASAVFGSNVVSNVEYAFGNCSLLTNIVISPFNSVYSSVAGVLFNKSQSQLLFYPARRAGSYTVPSSVTNISSDAFFACYWLTSVTIPSGVTNIGQYAFYYCNHLTNIYFQGNAPSVDPTAFQYDSSASVYYLPGTSGWSSTFEGLPTVFWNPQAQTSGANFGIKSNKFGFNITGSGNLVFVVEACTNFANPIWLPVSTNTLTGGAAYFSDPQWTNYPGRFYRLRSP